MLLGGNTATLWRGARDRSSARPPQVFRHPHDLATARVFSDPPLNSLRHRKAGDGCPRHRRAASPAAGALRGLPDGAYAIGVPRPPPRLEPLGGARLRCRRPSPSPRSPARRASSIVDAAPLGRAGARRHAIAPGTAIEPSRSARALRLRRGGALAPPPSREGGLRRRHGPDHLDHLAHAYKPIRRRRRTTPSRRSTMSGTEGGAYALLGPVRLREDHAAQHHLRAGASDARARILFDDRDVTRPADRGAQHRAGVPVPGRLRHHDGAREPRFSLRNRRVRGTRVRRPGRARSRACSTSTACSTARRSDLTADMKQKISLGRGLVRADVAAILFDEPLTVIDPHLKWQLRSSSRSCIAARHHDDLRDARPDRGADLRRQGGGDARWRGGADRHAGRAVRAAGAYLRRLFHRLARHERDAVPRRGRDGASSRASAIASRPRLPRPLPAARSSSASGPEFVQLQPADPGFRCWCGGSTISGVPESPGSSWRDACCRPSVPEALAIDGDRAALVFDPPRAHLCGRALCRRRAGSPSRRARQGAVMTKTLNNKAWFLVLPVLRSWRSRPCCR